MSLFDRIFKPNRKTQEKVQNEGTRFITTEYDRGNAIKWNGELFDNDLVRAAIDAKARHISKLKVLVQGSAKQELMKKLVDSMVVLLMLLRLSIQDTSKIGGRKNGII